MHIIHTIGGIEERSGGPSRTVTSLCSSIANIGVKVDLVAGFDKSSDDLLINPNLTNVGMYLLNANKIFGQRFLPNISSTLLKLINSKETPTLIHDHGIWGYNNLIAWKSARNNNIPYILSPRGMLEPWALEYKGSKKKVAWGLYQKRIISSASILIATSQQEYQNIRKLFPNKSIAIIPNGIYIPRLDKVTVKNIHNNTGKILFMSRIHPKKNIKGLLHAWKIAIDKIGSNWRLIIAGPDELGHSNEMIKLAKDLGLHESVKFIGVVEEKNKSKIYKEADYFVLPSFSENFGVVVTEALSYGLPVIATTGTPWRNLLKRGCGWWVEPDAESLASAIIEATNCTIDQRSEMAVLARAYAMEFEWRNIANNMKDVYLWALKLGPKPNTILVE